MSTPHPTKRFNPNTLTERIVPLLLIVLALALLAVFVIIGLSLTGVFPPA
jgi:hypothetical protein